MSDQKHGISRRSFIKGAALGAAGVAGAGLLGGCAPGESQQPAESSTAKYSFETPPAPIPDSKIQKTITADIIVIGAGTAGLCTASRALESGAKVVMISKDQMVSARGGSNFAIGSKLSKELGLEFDVVPVYERLLQFHSHHVNEELWWLFANKSGEAMDWLIDRMAAAGLKPVLQRWNADPLIGEYPGTHMFLGGPNGASTADHPQLDVLNALMDHCLKLGMENYFEVRAEQLVREDNGRVTAVIAQNKDGSYDKYVGEKAVVLATGDYGADEEMKARYAPIAAGHAPLYAPAGSNSGDGHKMALWVGASMQRCEPHASMIFAVASDFDATVYKRLESNETVLNAFEYLLANGCSIFNVNVNKYGKRYSNEHMVDAYQGMALRLQDSTVAYGIWDSKLPWQKPIPSPYEGAATPNPEEVLKGLNMLADDGVLYIKSDTLEGLAEQFKLPAENLKATVERYNRFCRNGKDEDFGKPAEFLFPLDSPPYFGMRFEPKLLVTVGGLLINSKMQVLDTESNVIPGLYAIGTVGGDFFANAYTHHFPGHNLGRCVTFGYLAGKSITEDA